MMVKRNTLQGLVKWSLISSGFVMFFILILFPISSMFSYAFIDETSASEVHLVEGEALNRGQPVGAGVLTLSLSHGAVLWDADFSVTLNGTGELREGGEEWNVTHSLYSCDLSDGYVFPGTLAVWKNGVAMEEREGAGDTEYDYTVDYEKGRIQFKRAVVDTDNISASYEYAPYSVVAGEGRVVFDEPLPAGSTVTADYSYTESVTEKDFDPAGFYDSITSDDAVDAFKNSLVLAVFTTFVNMVVGTLLAYILVKYSFPGKEVFKALIDMPIAIPTAVVGLALISLYGPKGVLGPMLADGGIEMIRNMPGVLLGHIFVTFPFMVRSVTVVLEKIDASHEEAALTLGATRLETFFLVTLPAIRGGLIAGAAMVFTRSLGEFGSTLLIAGGMVSTGPLYIYKLNEAQMDFQGAAAVAIVLMVFPFLLLLSFNYLVKHLEG